MASNVIPRPGELWIGLGNRKHGDAAVIVERVTSAGSVKVRKVAHGRNRAHKDARYTIHAEEWQARFRPAKMSKRGA